MIPYACDTLDSKCLNPLRPFIFVFTEKNRANARKLNFHIHISGNSPLREIERERKFPFSALDKTGVQVHLGIKQFIMDWEGEAGSIAKKKLPGSEKLLVLIVFFLW